MKILRSKNRSRPRVLLLLMEFPFWKYAKTVSYCTQLGIGAALEANGAEVLTVTTPWFSQIRELCSGRKFDQVWIDIVHAWLGQSLFQDGRLLEWLTEVGEVRVGFMPESLRYLDEECETDPVLQGRFDRVMKRCRHLTHVVACDEVDALYLNESGPVPAIWWPQAVPERLIRDQDAWTLKTPATFCGSVYGERAAWLKLPELNGLLDVCIPPDALSSIPTLFNLLHVPVRAAHKIGVPPFSSSATMYLIGLRWIRGRAFRMWLEGLARGCAVVNLPHYVKTYAGRVVEAMAAGMPVISWEIPDRPRNRALFEDDSEILLFSKNDPIQLAEQIKRIQSDADLARTITTNARRRIREFHTLEKRIKQVLSWIETGQQPVYA
jgi:hypothetical protein